VKYFLVHIGSYDLEIVRYYQSFKDILLKEAIMSVFDVFRNAMLAGLGMQEKVKEFVDELVKKGELNESQGAKLVKEWSEKAEKNTDDLSKSLNDAVTGALDKINLSTKEDIDKLNGKIDALAARIAKIEGTKE
jgi:polyhydroxyalkanoate synthesis regulator phasin